MKKSLLLAVIAISVVLLSGCAAIGTAIKHRNLQTQTLMSKSIFLDPVPNSKKTIYVQVRNTTDEAGFNIKPQLITNLIDNGYRIKQNLADAHYLLQVNVLRVGRSSKTAATEMMGSGYGGTLEGAGAGVAVAAMSGGGHMVGAGVAGAVAGTIANNLVKDVNYSGVVDVKITERGVSGKHSGNIHRTRIIVMADKVNLSFDKASPKLKHDLALSIAGIF